MDKHLELLSEAYDEILQAQGSMHCETNDNTSKLLEDIRNYLADKGINV